MTRQKAPIKICFIAPKAYPLFDQDVKTAFGGSEVDQYFLARELAKDDDFEISFITADHGQEPCRTIEGVCVIKSLDFKENPVTGAIKIWRAMRIADAQIYIRKAPSPAVFWLALFCKLKRRIFVYRTASQGECDGGYFKVHRLMGFAFKWVLKNAHVVLTQNRSHRQQLKESLGISSVVIPNGHPLAPLKGADRNSVLWVGRSAKIKGPGVFVELAEKIPEEQFTMICQRATGDNDFQTLADRAAEVENLEFIDHVPFRKIDAYFGRAKVFVNTSEAEGFPNTFIQAAQHAVAILSLNVNPDGFLDEYECGICCNGNRERLAEALKSLLEEKKYVKIGENARSYVEKKHDVATIVERYKELFGELM